MFINMVGYRKFTFSRNVTVNVACPGAFEDLSDLGLVRDMNRFMLPPFYTPG